RPVAVRPWGSPLAPNLLRRRGGGGGGGRLLGRGAGRSAPCLALLVELTNQFVGDVQAGGGVEQPGVRLFKHHGEAVALSDALNNRLHLAEDAAQRLALGLRQLGAALLE